MSSTEGMQTLGYFAVEADVGTLASACFYDDSRLWIGNPAVITAIRTAESFVTCHYKRGRSEYTFYMVHLSHGT